MFTVISLGVELLVPIFLKNLNFFKNKLKYVQRLFKKQLAPVIEAEHYKYIKYKVIVTAPTNSHKMKQIIHFACLLVTPAM